ncbi:MAG: hypothetical protein H7Y41_05775, partial [Hyphomonadaceae bacterium]|nr:hypothetical protein [Clostridia bacterium]
MKRMLSGLIVLCFMLTLAPMTLAQDDLGRLDGAVTLYIGSPMSMIGTQQKQIDKNNASVSPILLNNRTLVPVRYIAEALGATVTWNATQKAVDIQTSTSQVHMVVGSAVMQANGKDITLDVSVIIQNDRTLVPLRAVSEGLGKKVFYDRGLIIVSDQEAIFDVAKDKPLIDSVIAKVNDLPTIGTSEKYNELTKAFGGGGGARLYTTRDS